MPAARFCRSCCQRVGEVIVKKCKETGKRALKVFDLVRKGESDMQKIMVAGFMAAVIMAMGAGSARAGWVHDGGIERREWRQEHRIDHGIRSGRLTPREARRLMAQQHRIRWEKQRMMSDGHFTARERMRLHHHMNMANRDIWRMSHNGNYR
jgi:hypothetical protein